MGHLKMMSAAQPFLSGAISKTVNLPNEASTEDIELAYLEAWRLGLKAVAVYRDGCKRSQPLNTKREVKAEAPAPQVVIERIARRRLQDERQAITHKFSIAGHEGYLTVGMYEDGQPGELFITMAKEGSTVSGLMDAYATAISLALQYGVPLPVLVSKFSHTRFEPSGFTNNPNLPIAKSITDYIFRWLALKFLPKDQEQSSSDAGFSPMPQIPTPFPSMPVADSAAVKAAFLNQADAPPCPVCGTITVRNGACYKCHNCGATTGCS
jgi:ribonucleoside-diphosphate reductase alpha chain